MFWKDELALEVIKNQDSISYSWLLSLQSRFPSLRVKTVDVKGRVPAIQLSGKGEWLKPLEWANSHVANLKQQCGELHSRLEHLGCDPSDSLQNGAATNQLNRDRSNDLAEITELQGKYDKACKNYRAAMELVILLDSGEKLSLESRTKVSTYIKNEKRVFVF